MTTARTAHPYSKARLDRLVGDIESAILSGDRVRQSQIVRRSADLLVKCWSCLPAADKPAFDMLLYNLAGEIDADARRAFAMRLADLRRGPPKAISRLARDPDGSVAAMLLERGRSLLIDELGDIAASCGNSHRRALARRSQIGPRITDQLLAYGDATVAVAVAENASARVSPAGFTVLLRRAAQFERLALLLLSHSDLHEHGHAALLQLTLSRATTTLHEEFSGNLTSAQALLAQAQAGFGTCDPARADRFRASVAFIVESFETVAPTPRQISRWLALNRIEDVLAALARAASLPIEAVVAAYDARTGTAFATIVRGAEWPWEILKTLLKMSRRDEDRSDTFNKSYELMRDVSPLCARRLVRFCAARGRIGAFLGTNGLTWPEMKIAADISVASLEVARLAQASREALPRAG